MDSARDGYLLPRPLRLLARWSRARILTVAVTLSILLGVIDRITGPQFSFTIFYLVPVALVAWRAAAAQGNGWAGAEETQHRILDSLEAFARGDYHDDVTTLVLAVKPNGGP